MNGSASLAWFAHHELNLAWRDWVALMSGGKKRTGKAILIGMIVFALVLHGVAYGLLAPHIAPGMAIDKQMLVAITGSILLTVTMMLSQSMESVTRAFYSRDDLDLILSSPASASDLFAVRIAMIAITTAMMSGLIVAPFINVAALLGGPSWLMAYGVVFALAGLATGCSVFIALLLFQTFGAKRTRLYSQIAAAIVGASFLIGIQVVAIISYGSMSRWEVFNAPFIIDNVPNTSSFVWIPALAVTGHFFPALALISAAVAFFLYATSKGAKQFRHLALAALEVAPDTFRNHRRRKTFTASSVPYTLMQKEWTLLARDPWLISQTLMQVLYLVPPAVLLWVNYGASTEMSVIVAPVVVMAIGQLSGGLAWLTISGEDAPDLVGTAPVNPASLTWAKIKSVLVIVAILVSPLVIGIALMSVWGALVTFIGALIAAGCAILIQLWFRGQSKRSNFRRRQVASKASTFCEAFASILCAGTAALAALGSFIALFPAMLAASVMAFAWWISPARSA